ncbi:helix-turn-helix transcriptional regulator [uncultured Phenylobacterium sp.]|uniref:helix-turn-helix domain-containing protein n=1 Tax=uncultured Phenylobacterium sp. TaxID=349273 RepID=UPI0025D4006A|nr:helix-turn-helix transcriptional regulator [uncultured Phenylobacterium sp.]
MKGRALLAWNLRALRTAKSLSQERLAIDAGVDRAWVSELEREQGNTSVDLLDRLAEALDVPVAALLAEPEPDADKPQPLRSGRRRRE